jgi:AcrR family transcriptional regulator
VEVEVAPARSTRAKPAAAAADASRVPTPSDGRELRSQGRRTMAALLDAGMQVLAERGYHAARVDDVVRVADVSHGTFYLYFSNKEDLFRALAVQCADEMTALAGSLGEVTPGEDGLAELRSWLGDFLRTYRKYGVVIRAWMEDQVTSGDLARLGRKAFTGITGCFVDQLRTSQGIDRRQAEIEAAALLAMIERTTYFVTSRNLDVDDDQMADTLARLAYRGFFAPS